MGTTNNPWLVIPLADYEAHMALPQVGQARLLSDVFASALEECLPQSVAVLGCAGGNGFDRISPQVTTRVVGVDLNPTYLVEARARFGERLPGLQLVAADLERDSIDFAPVDLVFAALVLEYVDIDQTLPRIATMLQPHGVLVTVVQLPSDSIAEVTPSPYSSLGALAPVMHLVSPEQLRERAFAHDLPLIGERQVEVPGGKRFQVQAFRR